MGKTTLEQEIGEALAEAGRSMVALAKSVKSSREVLRREAGIATAHTVARFSKEGAGFCSQERPTPSDQRPRAVRLTSPKPSVI